MVCSVLLWAGLLAVLLWPVSITLADPVAIPQSTTMVPIGEITRGLTVRQQLPAPGTTLSSVSLLLGTYRRTPVGSLEIAIEIADRDGDVDPDQPRATVALSQIPDTVPYTLTFSPPLALPPTEHLAIALSSDAAPGEAITWWTTPKWKRLGYQLFVDDQPVVWQCDHDRELSGHPGSAAEHAPGYLGSNYGVPRSTLADHVAARIARRHRHRQRRTGTLVNGSATERRTVYFWPEEEKHRDRSG